MNREKGSRRVHQQRRCLGCKRSSSKGGLARLTYAMRSGGLRWDRQGALGGRGAYVHLQEACIRNAHNRSAWEHALKLAEGTIEEIPLKRVLQELREQCPEFLSGESSEKGSRQGGNSKQGRLGKRTPDRMRL